MKPQNMYFWLMVVCLSFLSTQASVAWNPPDTLVGTWSDKAEVFAPFKKSPYPSKAPEDWIRIQIQIHVDGTVDGQVGDAQFVGCEVRSNRGWLGRKLNVKTDYIICDGALTGTIVSTDKETKRYFTIPFNVADGKLKGGFMVLKKWKYPFPMFPRLELMKQTPNRASEAIGTEAAPQPHRRR